MIREVTRLVKRLFKKEKSKIFTTLIGQVVSYDGATNTCSVIPVQRRIRVNDPNHTTTIDLPQLDDVPVKQFGSGKLLFSVAPQEGSYGEITICQRSIERWALDGGIGDPDSARMFDISDALFSPGLYPQAVDGDNGLIEEPIQTDRIEMRTRSAVTSIAVIDDETLEIKNEKCTIGIDVDGNVALTTEGNISAESTGGDVDTVSDGDTTLTATGNIVTSAAETVLQDGSDYAIQFTAMQTAFDTLKSELNTLVTTFTAHTHPYVDTPVGAAVTSPTTTPGVAPAASMASAKVTDVRLP
jgi:hypothetical protein